MTGRTLSGQMRPNLNLLDAIIPTVIGVQNAQHITPTTKIPTLKFGGGNIIVKDCFSAYCGKCHIVEGRMNGKIY